MKICMLNEKFANGGVSKISKALGEKLTDSGICETFYYSLFESNQFLHGNNKIYSSRELIKETSIFYKIYRKIFRGINRIIFPQKKVLNFFEKQKVKEFEEFAQAHKIDVVIVSGGLITSLIPHLKTKLDSIKFIAWQHNDFYIYFNNYYKKITKSLTDGLREADCVVCLTEEDRKQFSVYNKNTVCISNFVESEEKSISSLDKKIISFVSRYSIKQKGIDLLVKLAKTIPEDWVISFAGSGTAKEIQDVKNLILRNNVSDKIILVGELSGEKLQAHYLNSSIFLSTSRWEGFGLVIVEAMGFGLPIISFQTSGPNEILNQGEFGIVVPKFDLKAMSDSISELASNYDERKFYQEKSIARAKAFSPKVIMNRWETIIRKTEG